MTRWLGAIWVAGCGLWLGLQRTVWYTRRVETIQGLLEAISLMEWELKDRQTPMPELLRRAEEGSRGSVRTFFAQCGGQMDELGSRSFGRIWTQAAELSQLPLDREDLLILEGLGQVLGRYDQQSQCQALAQGRNRLTRRLEQAREDRDRLGRLSGVLGGAAGLLAVILML